MKIEVGMMIRDEEGEFAKVIKLNEFDEDCFDAKYKDFEIEMWKGEIKSASNNIIDLVEVGDYVNGYLIEDLKKNGVWISDRMIKTIVTKEQFKSVEFEVDNSGN